MSIVSMSMVNAKMKELRLEHGFTQQYVADALGIDRSNYSKYEPASWNRTPTCSSRSQNSTMSPPTISSASNPDKHRKCGVFLCDFNVHRAQKHSIKLFVTSVPHPRRDPRVFVAVRRSSAGGSPVARSLLITS